MSINALLSRWRSEPNIGGNIVAWKTIPAREARYRPVPAGVHPGLKSALKARGVQSLYFHQAAAWEHAQKRENIVVVTGTASGKTLCYNLPVLDGLIKDPDGRALFLFPTKALAQDQLSNINALLTYASTSVRPEDLPPAASYDGDTPSNARPAIRQNARIVISNPDMLHTGILPHHTSWAAFFRSLRFVVVDEMHVYRGIFGSHVANVIRRLKRVARHYGSFPQFILTSATIGNPLQLAGWLVEESCVLIDDDGSARGQKHFLIYNPPVVNKELGVRRSLLQESIQLAEDLRIHNIQTILFGRSRRSVEIMLRYLREKAGAESPAARPGASPALAASAPDDVRGYRSGYLPRQRREIERRLREGQVRAVVATTALELGIDIGGMGASILAGYPGTIAGTWQQAGRAGRGQESSLSILVTSASPLDQFLAAHPDYFFGRSPERALINPDNLLILLGHMRCAAFELPFKTGEAFGRVEPERVAEFLEFLAGEGILHRSGDRYYWMADRYPAESVSLRSTSPEVFVLQVEDNGEVRTIGQVDAPSASWMVHPGAIYLHEAQTYLVEELDLEGKIARLRNITTDYYTEPRSETSVALIEKLGEREARGCRIAHGELQVTTQVIGYRKVRWYTNEILGLGELSLPPAELQTTGYWIGLNEETIRQLEDKGLWTNSPNDYGPLWPLLRQKVRERDGYRCQLCRTPEAGRAHDVHHKIPFRSYSTREEANQLSNLVTLCPRCHHQVETAVRIRSGLSGMSFVFNNLAPLYLMSDSRDIGVHSDPQSPLTNGTPALVIYDGAPGGIGFSEQLFELHSTLISAARDLVSSCPCAEGCPSCVGPGGENGMGGKRESLALLDLLVEEHLN